jgi:CheY-like chemotaxis protein
MTERPSRLLVVDDDAVNRDLLSRRLVRAGYDVATAASGLEALGRLAQHDVDLVLLDVQMPQMSGLDVLEAIRSTPAPQRVAVLMVTAKDQSDDIVSALERGADDYITKPIDFPVALARIKTQLARKRLEDRSRETEERFALVSAFLDGLWDWKLTANEIYLSPRWKPRSARTRTSGSGACIRPTARGCSATSTRTSRATRRRSRASTESVTRTARTAGC